MFNRRNWFILNVKVTVAEKLVSSGSQNIPIYIFSATSHKVAILSDDVIVDDRWIIPSIFLQQNVKQLEVIREVVLSEVSELNDLEG